MLQIADEVILDPEIALIDFGDEGQLIHVLEDRALAIVTDGAARVAIAEAVDAVPGAAVGNLLDGEIEFVAADEVERARRFEAFPRLDRDLGADEADLELRVRVLHRLRDLHVVGKGRRRGVHHHELVFLRQRQHIAEAQPGRGRVDKAAALDQRRRLRKPGRKPERADFAPRLITRARAAVETFERRRLQEQSFHHAVRPLIPVIPGFLHRRSFCRRRRPGSDGRATRRCGRGS